MAGEDGLLLIVNSETRRVEASEVLPARGRSVAFRYTQPQQETMGL